MEAVGHRLAAEDDPKRYFHATYLRTTRAVRDEIERGGFADPGWVERWDVAFAGLYLDALARYEETATTSGPWQVAFDEARRAGAVSAGRPLPPLRHVLLGMNAHINYDLPQALLAVIDPEVFDDPLAIASREADHRHIDTVLAARVAEEDRELARIELPGTRTRVDRLLAPLNTAGTRRFLRESRRKVWGNARQLDRARRQGPDRYAALLADLEDLARARVADLAAPGQVILRLARRGFGVTLAPHAGAPEQRR